MSFENSKKTDQKLQKANSQMIADIVLSNNASSLEIESGIYKPMSKITSLIDIDKLLEMQITKPPRNSSKKSKTKRRH
jgi:hypothetical protein